MISDCPLVLQLIEYNDKIDQANISLVPPSDVAPPTVLSDVTWDNSGKYSNVQDNVIVLYNDASYGNDSARQNASVTFKVSLK